MVIRIGDLLSKNKPLHYSIYIYIYISGVTFNSVGIYVLGSAAVYIIDTLPCDSQIRLMLMMALEGRFRKRNESGQLLKIKNTIMIK